MQRNNSVQTKTDIQRVFQHLCPIDAFTIESQYLMNALLQAGIIDHMNFIVLNTTIQEIMDETSLHGTMGSKQREPLNASSNNSATPGPIVSTKYMNQDQLNQHK